MVSESDPSSRSVSALSHMVAEVDTELQNTGIPKNGGSTHRRQQQRHQFSSKMRASCRCLFSTFSLHSGFFWVLFGTESLDHEDKSFKIPGCLYTKMHWMMKSSNQSIILSENLSILKHTPKHNTTHKHTHKHNTPNQQNTTMVTRLTPV